MRYNIDGCNGFEDLSLYPPHSIIDDMENESMWSVYTELEGTTKVIQITWTPSSTTLNYLKHVMTIHEHHNGNVIKLLKWTRHRHYADTIRTRPNPRTQIVEVTNTSIILTVKFPECKGLQYRRVNQNLTTDLTAQEVELVLRLPVYWGTGTHTKGSTYWHEREHSVYHPFPIIKRYVMSCKVSSYRNVYELECHEVNPFPRSPVNVGTYHFDYHQENKGRG